VLAEVVVALEAAGRALDPGELLLLGRNGSVDEAGGTDREAAAADQ
jgi:hypothetical protein